MAADQWWTAFIGVVGIVAGASMVWLKEWFTSRWHQKKQARYLAVRMVCILDDFVDGCVEVVKDKGVYTRDQNGQETLGLGVKEPDLPTFPETLDWRSIDHKLAYRILSLPISVKAAGDATSFAFSEIAGPPDYEEGFEMRQEQFAKLGLKVTSIARDLRRKYDIPENEERYWDPDRVFQEKLNEIED